MGNAAAKKYGVAANIAKFKVRLNSKAQQLSHHLKKLRHINIKIDTRTKVKHTSTARRGT